MDASEGLHTASPDGPTRAALLRVLHSARQFVAVHEEAADAHHAAAPGPASQGIADGVERDCLAFGIERAARALREAVRAAAREATGPVSRPQSSTDNED